MPKRKLFHIFEMNIDISLGPSIKDVRTLGEKGASNDGDNRVQGERAG